ncbi:MAG: nitrophenyl compound nitroreductase subunit ArsF family protein [Bacteroidota bacterium]
MKTIKMISVLFVLAGMSISCTGQTNKKEETSVKKADDVQVYYFHTSRRCATCKAVETETKKAVEELYGDKVPFATYNIEKAEGEQKAEELNVPGQALLIVSGDTKINITREGFMNARSNPDKLKQIIKSKIDPLVD